MRLIKLFHISQNFFMQIFIFNFFMEIIIQTNPPIRKMRLSHMPEFKCRIRINKTNFMVHMNKFTNVNLFNEFNHISKIILIKNKLSRFLSHDVVPWFSKEDYSSLYLKITSNVFN